MKRRKMIKLIISIIVAIAVILILIQIFTKKGDEKRRLESLYEELNASQTYLFEMKQNDDSKTVMAKKGDKTRIDQYAKDSYMTTIVKDNTTYLVLHDREEYYVYEENNVEQNILTDGFGEVIQKDIITGEDKIKGKKYYFEEYNGSTMFMISSTLDADEKDMRTRFYFDKDDNLVYIQTINGAKQELLKVSIEKEVDDSIFEIPSTYAEN